MKIKAYTISTLTLFLAAASYGQFISEFEPNPAGTDPVNQFVEVAGGTAGGFYDLWVLSIENDGFNGTVDRATRHQGFYNGSGMAVLNVPDLENPSNTLVLASNFTGTVGVTDIDPLDDGVLSLTSIGTIYDAIGVSDSESDDASLYGALLGGENVLFNEQFEPLLIFRDSVTGDLWNTVTVDFGGVDEHIGVFNSLGGGFEYDAAWFNIDPLVSTFGATNPTLVVPEPSTIAAIFGLFALGFVMYRRRR